MRTCTTGAGQKVEKPWIAYKVLAAGAVRPSDGFKFALENGADFMCVGMFDFQIKENCELVRRLVEKARNRPSGEKARLHTRPAPPSSVRTSVPSSTSAFSISGERIGPGMLSSS